MSKTLLTYFSDSEDEQPQWTVCQGTDSFSPIKTELDELKFKAKNLSLQVILPAEGFSCFKTDIKTNNHKRLMQAVGFFLQDRVLDSTDDLFFALDKKKSGDAKIWLCKTSLMEGWLEHLNDLDLVPERIIPAPLLMAPLEADYALWLLADKAVLHDGLNFVFLQQDNIDKVLDSVVTQPPQNNEDNDNDNDNNDDELVFLPSCEVHIFADSLQPKFDKHKNIDFEHHEHSDDVSVLEVLAKRINHHSSFNLLQGEFSKPDYIMEKLKPWRVSLVLLLLLGFLYLISFIPDIYRAQKTSDALQAKIQQVYVSSFPGEAPPNDPYASMQQKIKNLKPLTNQNRVYLSNILSGMSRFVVGNNKIIINNIAFSDDKTKVQVEARDIALIERLPASMNQGKYSVKVISVSEKVSGSHGVLEIK